MKEPDVKVPPVSCQYLTARAYREAIRKRDFGSQDRKLLDVIVHYWLEAPAELQPFAIIPRQGFFSLLTGLPKSKVSERLDYLRRAHVVESGKVEVVVSSRKQWWCTWCLNPPGQWKVSDLVADTPLLREVESWLNGLTAAQTEFLAPPPTLAQLLREDFACQTAGESRSRVDGFIAASGSSADAVRPGSPRGDVEVPSEGTAEVPREGTFSVPAEGTAGDRSRSGSSRSGYPGTSRSPYSKSNRSISINRVELEAESSLGGNSGSGEDYRAYVSGRLYELIGSHEREGMSGPAFERALRDIPERVDELVSYCREKMRLGTLVGAPGAWMNASVRSELAKARAPVK